MTEAEINNLEPGDEIIWGNAITKDNKPLKFTYIAPQEWVCNRLESENCCKFTHETNLHAFRDRELLASNTVLVKKAILIELPIKDIPRLSCIEYD